MFFLLFYIDCGDKWLRSFVDNVVPLAGRRICFEGISNCFLFIAFLTASVNDENDETVWIDSFFIPLVFDKTLESIEDTVWGFEFDDDNEFGNIEFFVWSDETISANGVHRLVPIDDDVVDAESIGARK